MNMGAESLLARAEELQFQLGCAIFPDRTLEEMKAAPIDRLEQIFRSELETILLVGRLVENGTDPLDIGRLLRTHELHSKDRAGTHKEALGFSLKAICSNIRRQDVDWDQYRVVQNGIGAEGDIVIARALGNTGSTNHVENQYGRDVRLFAGDTFLGVLGHRHSGTSEYGELPDKLEITADTDVDLLCHGGILGRGICIPNSKPCKTFFGVRIAGLVRNGDSNLNLLDLYSGLETELLPSAPIIFNCGTSAEIGKTTSSSSIIRALKRRGLKVGSTKLAGTGRFRDLLATRDAGADVYHDFPDVGLASTYTTADRSYAAAVTLLNKLNRQHVDVIVAEMGGDIIEANIPAILCSREIMGYASGIIHSSADILGILGSLQKYKEFGVDVPVKITLPKDRNNAGTVDRLSHQGLQAFNVLVDGDCDTVIQSLLPQKALS